MKQLTLLLLLFPLISFGKNIEIKSTNKENPWVYENGNNKRVTYWGIDNNIEINTKITHYYKGKKHAEVSFKGFFYETYDNKNSDGVIKKVTSTEK